MIDLEASLDKMEQELREINGNADVFLNFIVCNANFNNLLFFL